MAKKKKSLMKKITGRLSSMAPHWNAIIDSLMWCIETPSYQAQCLLAKLYILE